MRALTGLLSILLLALAAPGCGASAAPAQTPTEGMQAQREPEPEPLPTSAPARLPDTVTPTRYTLSLGISPSLERFTGVADIAVRLSETTDRIWIHGRGLMVSEVTVTPDQGEAVTAEYDVIDGEEGVVLLVLRSAVPAGAAIIHIAYTAPYDASLEGLYRVAVGEDHYAFTQFEALAARKAFPCFDEPRWKTPYDVTLTVPQTMRAFANTHELESTDLPDGSRRVHFAASAALPTYLVAWAVGPFDVVEGTIPPNAVRDRPLPFRGLAARGRGAELAYAMEHTPRIVTALETFFGTPYPFDKLDIVAVPDFAAGAMENAGLVTFRDVLLLLAEDAPVSQRRGFAFVMAHELAHQWFGNLVTMAWWDDLWLNEAFATWMETHTIEGVFPELRPEIAELSTYIDAFDADSLASARRIRNPIQTSHDIQNAFDSITYSKGASVLAMFEHYVGPDVFQRAVRRYLAEHAGGSATGADFIGALAAESGRPEVGAALSSFLDQPGVPFVSATPVCEGGEARLDLVQSRYLPLGSAADASLRWQVPVCARWRSGGEVHEGCTLLTTEQGSMPLPGGCPDWVIPNANGTGYYRWTLPDEWLARLGGRGASQLTPRDRLSTADSVRAGFDAGRVSLPAAMQTLSPFATSTERELAGAPMSLLGFARDHLIEGDRAETSFQRYAARLYAGQLRRLGWEARRGATEDGETRLLRASVIGFMAREAEDARTRAEAVRRGRAYLGIGAREHAGEIHADAVAVDLVETALVVAAQEGGAEVFDALDRFLGGSQDAVLRRRLLTAMAHVDDAELRPRALALALDQRLRLNEIFTPLVGQLSDPEGRDAAWTWVQSNYDALAARMGPAYSGYLPFVASGFCTPARAEEVRVFFTPRMEATMGGPRNLEAVVESIQLCAARAEAQRAGATELFH